MLFDLLKKLWPSKIRSQLILGISFICVILMSLLVIQLVDRQKNFLLKLNHDRAVGLSTNLANTANSYVLSYELAGLQKLITTYKNIPDIKYSLVTSEDGTVLAHTDEKYNGLKATDSISAKLKPINATQILIENNSVLDVATPITNHGEIIGWARTGLSQEYIKSNLKDIEKRGIIYILISLIVGSIFAIIVADRLSKGLQKLVSAARKIKDGDRDLRVGPSRSIEISQLGTAFNQMLDDISANEKLLSMVLENMPVGIWILDDKGNIISVNPAGKEMWKGIKYVGIDEYNLYKGWFTETGKEVQNQEWGAAIVLAEGRSVLNQEIEIECFDKSHKIILNSAIPLRDANKKIIGVITINVDITERKIAERELEKSEEKHRALIENIGDTIILLNENAELTYQSPAFVRTAGFELSELKGKTVFDLIHTDDKQSAKEIFMQAFKSPGVALQTQYQILNKKGSYFWAEGTIINLLNKESVKAFIVNFRDITERINAEKEKLEIQEKAMAMLEDKVVERTEELHKTNQILEVRNHEISDSINYAQHIQMAVLSKAEDYSKIFPDSFILWMPKDVVSGDFYWCYSHQKYDFIAVVDCTGHGVPAAMMSIIASEMLNKVVNTLGFLEPGEILFQLDNAIINYLKQESGIVKDGMDIAICRVDKANKLLMFAGAQRPLFYYNGKNFREINGSKHGVGGFLSDGRSKVFDQTEINYQKGDRFYLTSDGYYSQFGGEKGKKLMKKRMVEYISTIANSPLAEQKELLHEYYIKWQGNQEQVDDVLVIGVML